jgi:hypothetical protein
MKTKQDVTINYRNYGNITIPAGTTVTNMTACGIDKNYCFVNDFAWIIKNYPAIDRILIHDAKYYGINIPKEFIDFE